MDPSESEIELRPLLLYKKKLLKKLPASVVALSLVIVAVLGGSGFLFFKYQQAQKEIKKFKTLGVQAQNTYPSPPADAKKIIESASKLMKLPQGEEPTVATITDINKLKDQPIFQNAQNGDKILLYPKAKKVIIYNPNDNLIEDVVAVNPSTTPSSPSQPLLQPKIALKNGTTSLGLAAKMENDIKRSFPDASTISKDNAAKTDYDQSQIITFNQGFKDYADSLAKTFNLTAGNLPSGESKPSGADILIILGKDKI